MPRTSPHATDPFESVWDEESRVRMRALLARTASAAQECGVALFLHYGTLLGHIREGQILPWDDDLDLALLDGDERYALVTELEESGLEVVYDRWPTDREFPAIDPHGCLKVFEVSNEPILGRFGGLYTWPYVEIFVHTRFRDFFVCTSYHDGNVPLPVSAMLPGREAVFEQASFWEPELPLIVLDMLYPTWRTREVASTWSHRYERATGFSVARPIRTDRLGRRVAASDGRDTPIAGHRHDPEQ